MKRAYDHQKLDLFIENIALYKIPLQIFCQITSKSVKKTEWTKTAIRQYSIILIIRHANFEEDCNSSQRANKWAKDKLTDFVLIIQASIRN